LEITVSFLGIHKWEPDIYIGFSQALHLQCSQTEWLKCWISECQREFFPTELTSDEEMERNLSEWQWMNVLFESDGMNVCTIKYQNKLKRVASCYQTFRMSKCSTIKVVSNLKEKRPG
jgi:hypothetical protein